MRHVFCVLQSIEVGYGLGNCSQTHAAEVAIRHLSDSAIPKSPQMAFIQNSV